MGNTRIRILSSFSSKVINRGLEKDSMECRHGLRLHYLEHSQYTADGDRPTSACVLIAVYNVLDTIHGVPIQKLTDSARVAEKVLLGVRNWDLWPGNQTSAVAEEVLQFVANDQAQSNFDKVIMHVESIVLRSEDACAQKLSSVLLMFGSLACGAIITAPDGPCESTGVHVGNSWAIMREANNPACALIDTHRHHVRGQQLGTLILHAETTEALATYVFEKDGLLDSMNCSGSQLEVAITINARDLVQRDAHLSLMRSVSCFYQLTSCPSDQGCATLATPGDYLCDLFRGFI